MQCTRIIKLNVPFVTETYCLVANKLRPIIAYYFRRDTEPAYNVSIYK